MLMHDYPVYYDWWLQDGNDAKDIKDGKDVNWFRGSFSRQLSLRMQKLNITTAVMILRKVSKRLSSLI